MASPFQQQAQQRKFLYVGLILVLFTVSIVWRRGVIDALAGRLAIREESRGEVELIGAVVRLGLTGSRGLATCILWNNAMEKQKRNQWNELEVLVRSLTRLQPHFITPWLFQSWNLSYNVSVESDRVRDKYFYMTRGIELLAEGERQNQFHPDLRWSIGFYTQHKIGQSDETNYIRSLFQLSLIPPNERDPARFWKTGDSGPEFNWVAFHDFCTAHPQLVRRLNRGILRGTKSERRRLFTCERPEDVVQFLDDNYSVPSMYVVPTPPQDVPAPSRGWARQSDTPLDVDQRFPVLPPPHADAFDPTALSNASTLGDEIDGFSVAHTWYAYAQEPLPKPSPTLPGAWVEITDPARQRRPKRMTTLIFRHYPAMGRRYIAERLQEEGWYDGEGWDATELFREARDPDVSGKQVVVGGGRNWSLDAWARASAAWEEHGRSNLLLFANPGKEQSERDLATRFAEKHRIPLYGAPPTLPEAEMTPDALLEYRAARFMYEYEFYRRLTNFAHHYVRCLVEARPVTVQCRKMFYKAEEADLYASPRTALAFYTARLKVDGVETDALTAWRDQVLMENKDFRRDDFTQELTAEIQTRYLVLWNRADGLRMKEQLVKAAAVVPLLPRFNPVAFRPPIVEGPFSGTDGEGYPLIRPDVQDTVLDRLGLRRRTAPPGGPPTRPMEPPSGPGGLPPGR